MEAVYWTTALLADFPNNIMERRCPLMKRFSHGSAESVRVSKRKRLQPYALKVLPCLEFAQACMLLLTCALTIAP